MYSRGRRRSGGRVHYENFVEACHIPLGILAPLGASLRARKSFSISSIATHSTSSCVLTHSMKRSSIMSTSARVWSAAVRRSAVRYRAYEGDR